MGRCRSLWVVVGRFGSLWVVPRFSSYVESSDAGKKELANIFNEGNQYTSDKGMKAGECLKEVWRKDRESFFKDQRRNGMLTFFVLL